MLKPRARQQHHPQGGGRSGHGPPRRPDSPFRLI